MSLSSGCLGLALYFIFPFLNFKVDFLPLFYIQITSTCWLFSFEPNEDLDCSSNFHGNYLILTSLGYDMIMM
uniref:Uncharacterized protein n=1 Tax=Rhizophora mucronata TaxID=61149 RepID=A0A2P2KTN5_RHIMU